MKPARQVHGPLVSVAVPTYGRPDYLRRALASAVAQTYVDLEILVGDNGASADTEAVVRSFGDDRIAYLPWKQNLGLLGNNLALFRTSRGVFIANLHDDNFWREDFLERLVPPLDRDPSVMVAFSDYQLVDQHGRVDVERSRRLARQMGRSGLHEGVHRPAHDVALVSRAVQLGIAGVFRRSAVDFDHVPVETEMLYDFWLAYLALAGGAGAYYCPEQLSFFRIHEGAESHTRLLNFAASASFCFRGVLNDPRLVVHGPGLKREIAAILTWVATLLMLEGQGRAARPILREAWRFSPSTRTAAALIATLLPDRAMAWLARTAKSTLRRARGSRDSPAMAAATAAQPTME